MIDVLGVTKGKGF